jgi:hypothetical protein
MYIPTKLLGDTFKQTDLFIATYPRISSLKFGLCLQLSSLLSKGLRWGFCIPSSCKSEDLEVALSEYIGNTAGVNVTVGNTDCHFDQRNSFSPVDWVAM